MNPPLNPYWGENFFGFFAVLFRRLTGQLQLDQLASDEVQLLVLMGIALSTVLLGTFLTLKKMTMMANSLSHTTLLGIVIAYLLFFAPETDLTIDPRILLVGAFVSALLTTLFTELARDLLKLQEDAAIGLVFTTLFALGIILVTVFTRNSHLGVEVITGNVDALHFEDLKLIWLIAALNLVLMGLFFRQWVMTAFDEKFSFSLGLPTKTFHYLLMFLTALTLIASFRAVGVILVLSFLVGPTLIARQWTHRLRSLLLLGIGLGLCTALIGVALSRHFLSVYHLPLSTGGLVVTLISFFFILSLTFRASKGLIRQ
ncbi:MAG TPA: metal ABC transporter permease [Rhabdochlamydiaceae bacterium]|jgi:manganese/zinc/iron transport system permease protein|nr:metal ABC transporter permease [Rhabdochlamydiaceae bacterium]